MAAEPAVATQLAQLRTAADALRAALASSSSCQASAAAAADAAAALPASDWDTRLKEVNAVVGGAQRATTAAAAAGAAPAADQLCEGDNAGDSDGDAAVRGGASGGGAPSGLASGGLVSYQSELVEAASSSSGNSVMFLPLGLGLRAVLDAVLCRAVVQHPERHVLLVVDRPAHALSHAQRLRSELGLSTSVFCGGDFLYSFPHQFQSSRVLVFTAGLLLRLLKTGVYSLEHASLMVLLDAFTVVRNHPSNTLVREYWRGADEARRPRVLGLLASQLPSKPRPFDRLRQNLRKLCHSLQAQLLLPSGCGLAQMESQLHHDSIQLHSYALGSPEERLASLLQQHLLGLWDVLHEFGLNHFGRLVQFAAPAGGGAGAGGTPSTPAGAVRGGAAAGTPPTAESQKQEEQQAQQGSAVGTPVAARPLSGGSAAGSPATAEGSPATPLQGLLPQQGQQQHGGASSAAAAAAEQPDPMQHDWAQVELQVVHSLWHSNALPSKGDHVREPDALALQMHVLDCVRALRVLLEQGPAACLARLPDALESLAAFLQEGSGGALPFAPASVPQLRARILQVASSSPLLPWALQQAQQAQQAEAGGGGKEQQALDGQAQGEAAAAEKKPPASPPPRPLPPLPRLPPSPLLKPSPRRGAGAGGSAGINGGADGPRAAVAGGCARATALMELLQEMQIGCQLSGQRRQVALVAGSREAVGMLQQLVAATKELTLAEVFRLADAPPHAPSANASLTNNSHSMAASLSLTRSASIGGSIAVAAGAEAGAGSEESSADAAVGSKDAGATQGDGGSSCSLNGMGPAEEQGAEAAEQPAAPADASDAAAAPAAEAAPAEAATDGGDEAVAAPAASSPEAGVEAGGPFASTAAAAAAAGADAEAEAAAEEDAETPTLRSASATEAAVAAAWAHAAPTLRKGKLVVHLLTPEELPAVEERIAGYHSLVWYSSGDVLHAASQELESAALVACHRLSAAAAEAAVAAGGPRRSSRRLECHVLATASQVLALGEVRRVDHSLKAAIELVHLGDTIAEEKLTMLAHRNTATVLEREARAILEMLCCGLCGAAPAFATMTSSPSRKPSSSRRLAASATLAAAAAAISASAEAGAGAAAAQSGGSAADEADDAAEPSASLVAEDGAGGASAGAAGAAGTEAAAPAVAAVKGGEWAGEAEEEGAAPPPALLFRSSVTLPAAYFPPERFHAAGVSMPMDVFVGSSLPSEEEAANAAALLALATLHRLGIIVRYWPSRLLLAQHLLPRSLAAAAVGAPPPPAQQCTAGAAAGSGGEASAGVSPGATQGGTLGSSPGVQQVSPQQQQPPHVMNFFCPLCNVAATGHKAFDAHLRGFRHQRRIKQAQLLQQGQEVSAMLQGLLLEESLPSSAVPSPASTAAAPAGLGGVALQWPDSEELREGEEGGEHSSPSFADRQVYSPEPTPYRCDTCGVYCTSGLLLEAHTRGRKHQRRVAGLESPTARTSSPKVQPLVTPWFCGLCGLYATSEEQLRMHMLGKRHTRMTQLHRQRMAGGAGDGSAAGSALQQQQPASLQQQQHQLLVAAAAAAALSSGAAAWVPSSSSGVPAAGIDLDSPSPLPSPAMGGAPLLLGSGATAATSLHVGSGDGGMMGSGMSGSSMGTGSSMGGGSMILGEGTVALQGLLLDASGNQRIYRCDLCGVVTPSRRHYDYHLQGVKHTRRAMRAQGLDPGSASQPGTPASGCGSPQGGSRSASPSRGGAGAGARGRHSRHSSADWGASSGSAAGSGGGVPAGGLGGGAAAAMLAATGAPEPAPESLICSVCGIMATSAVNLEDHYRGRRHQKNVERQQAQQAAAAAAAAAAGASGKLPPLPPAVPSPFAVSAAAKAAASAASGGPGPMLRSPSLQRQQSGITLGADGLRLASGALLSAGSLLNASGSLQRSTSDVYDDYPCVRIGSILLPSSMDLRTFLEEMQQLDGTEDGEGDLLPPIAEHQETLGSELAAAVGIGPPSAAGGPANATGGLAVTAQLFTPSLAAASGANPAWAYGGVASTGNNGGTAGAPQHGSVGGSLGPSPSRGGGGGGGTPRRSPYNSHYGGSRTQPSSHSMYLPGGGGGFGRAGGRPGSAGNGGPRLSRFAQDQQQQQAAAAAAAGLGHGQQYGGQQYAQQYGVQQYGQQGYGMQGLGMGGMPGAYGMPPGMGMAQQAAAAAAYGGGYAAHGGGYGAGGGYDPSMSAALAAQQAAAMQQHQMAYGGAGMAGHHHPAAYGGMAAQQGQAYFAAPIGLPGIMPPPPPPPPSRYR